MNSMQLAALDRLRTTSDSPHDLPQWNALRAAYRAGVAAGRADADRMQKRFREAARRRGVYVKIGTAILALAVLAGPARAAPPPVGSDDWNVMHPYADWVTTQHDEAGRWCCNIADGRPVDAETRGNAWWAHITPEHFPGERDRWAEVPDNKVLHQANPTGSPILWLYQGRVQCFAPPAGV